MGVTKRDNKKLLTGSSEACERQSPFKVTYRITEAVLVLCCQIPSLATSLERPHSLMEVGHSLL